MAVCAESSVQGSCTMAVAGCLPFVRSVRNVTIIFSCRIYARKSMRSSPIACKMGGYVIEVS